MVYLHVMIVHVSESIVVHHHHLMPGIVPNMTVMQQQLTTTDMHLHVHLHMIDMFERVVFMTGLLHNHVHVNTNSRTLFVMLPVKYVIILAIMIATVITTGREIIHQEVPLIIIIVKQLTIVQLLVVILQEMIVKELH